LDPGNGIQDIPGPLEEVEPSEVIAMVGDLTSDLYGRSIKMSDLAFGCFVDASLVGLRGLIELHQGQFSDLDVISFRCTSEKGQIVGLAFDVHLDFSSVGIV
jgi:hypothetical protein